MTFVSNGLANAKWLNTLELRGPEFRQHVQSAQALLERREPDWMIGALHEAFRDHCSLADAVAFAVLSEFMDAGHLFLCLRPVRSWAQANARIEANNWALSSVRGERSIYNGNQGYDGWLRPSAPPAMKRVYLTDEETPLAEPVAFYEEETFPLEIGACSMSKSVAILAREGRLARLPKRAPMSGQRPSVYFLALRPKPKSVADLLFEDEEAT